MAKKPLTQAEKDTVTYLSSAPEWIRDGEHGGLRVCQGRSGHAIVECISCGFKHALPLPEPATLEHCYRDAYYATEKPDFLAHATEDQPWFELAQNDRLDLFENLLDKTRRRLLDIGCGPGFFLKTALARGWQVHGVEPSRQAARHARALGADISEAFFNSQSAARLGHFDAVTLTNVLEHVPNPIHILRLALDLLDRGGVVCVTVPNDFSAFQAAASSHLGLAQWWAATPHHLNYFDFDSLTSLLRRLGLEIMERTTSFPMEAFLLMGENYVEDGVLGRSCHAKRKRLDMALESAGLGNTRRRMYQALAGLGIGREAIVIALKP